jgi:hypothetical protein
MLSYFRRLGAVALGCAIALHPGLSAIAAGSDNAPGGREALVIVKGVATPFSVFGLLSRFRQIPGVTGATFDLSQGLADLTFKPDAVVSDHDIREAIRNASYTPGPIRWQNGTAQAGPPAH